jgi:hypothetical protein
MARGARIVNLFYPGRVRMPEHTAYPVNIDGRLGCVLLFKHLNPVEAIDFANEIRRETEGGSNKWTLQRPITTPDQHCIAMEGNGRLVYVFEDGIHYYRLFRPREFTELFIVYEVEDIGAITEEEKGRHTYILDQFIIAYRGFAGDVTVRTPNDLAGDYPFIRAAVREYSKDELNLSELDRIIHLRPMDARVEALPLGINPNMLTPPIIDPEHVGTVMSQFLASGERVPEPQTILVKATEQLKISQDYSYALLLAFFSIEQVVTELLQDIKRQAGISEATIKDYEAAIGMAYKINVELPLAFKPDHAIRALIPDLKGANTLRNGVVHKGRTATFQEAASVIQTADKLIKAISGG